MNTPANIIITIFGFFLAYGAVGTLDVDPQANVVQMFALACVGLILMYCGIAPLTERE